MKTYYPLSTSPGVSVLANPPPSGAALFIPTILPQSRQGAKAEAANLWNMAAAARKETEIWEKICYAGLGAAGLAGTALAFL